MPSRRVEEIALPHHKKHLHNRAAAVDEAAIQELCLAVVRFVVFTGQLFIIDTTNGRTKQPTDVGACCVSLCALFLLFSFFFFLHPRLPHHCRLLCLAYFALYPPPARPTCLVDSTPAPALLKIFFFYFIPHHSSHGDGE